MILLPNEQTMAKPTLLKKSSANERKGRQEVGKVRGFIARKKEQQKKEEK